MNGIHDMGGMQCMGPVVREADEPVFHTEWERRVFGIMLSLMGGAQFSVGAEEALKAQLVENGDRGLTALEPWRRRYQSRC